MSNNQFLAKIGGLLNTTRFFSLLKDSLPAMMQLRRVHWIIDTKLRLSVQLFPVVNGVASFALMGRPHDNGKYAQGRKAKPALSSTGGQPARGRFFVYLCHQVYKKQNKKAQSIIQL